MVYVYVAFGISELSKTARKTQTANVPHLMKPTIVQLLDGNKNPSGISLKHENDYLASELPTEYSRYLILDVAMINQHEIYFTFTPPILIS